MRFITNTTTRSAAELQQKLARMGLEARPEEIFSVITATVDYLVAQGRPSCFLLARDSVREAFAGIPQDFARPEVIVIGDIGARWDYDLLNRVFNLLMRGSRLICMHRNRYWQEEDGLSLDIGAFVAALEFASGQKAETIGKPDPAFFRQVLESLQLTASETAIVGDDIESDVGGGQACGLQGVLVQTGKYREALVHASPIQPDRIIPSIASLPELLEPSLRNGD